MESAFQEKVWRERWRIADECFVGARYEESAFRKFGVEELNIAESDQFERVIILGRHSRHRYGFARIDDPFAGLGLQLRQRRMLEGGEKIVGKLAFQTAVTLAACIQNDEISVSDILCLSSVVEQHPKRTDVIPEALIRRTVHA